LPIVAAAALTPAAWYLAAQAGPVPLLLWWLAGAWLVAVAGLVLVQFGPRHLRAVAFPLAFLLFTLPPPVRVQSAVQAPLQEATTSCAAAVLPRLGVPVERSGFVLRLPSGDLGVVEACSGVRSVSAIVAVAALVAFVRGLGAVRGLLLTLLALPVVAAANAVRVILSGVLLEAVGPWVNEGVAHEALGVVTLLAGLAGVLALSSCLRPGGGRRTEDGGRNEVSPIPSSVLRPPSCAGAWLAAGLLGAAALGSGAAAWTGARVAPADEQSAPLEMLAHDLGPWRGTDEPIAPDVRAELGYDQAVYRVYRNAVGQRVHAWVLYWSAAGAGKEYVHHPDVCWPNRGWAAVDGGRKPVPLAPPAALSASVRRFERDGQRQVIYYWAQDGAAVWSEEDERRARSGSGSPGWVVDRLTGHVTPRLVVLVGADLWDASGYAEQAVEEFVGTFAAELYRVCPWARPGER
jgi:EpsI family protein